MNIKDIFKVIIEDMYKEYPLKIGKCEGYTVVCLKRGTVLVCIPEKDFIFDTDKITSKDGGEISDRLLRDLLTITKEHIQVFPTATTVETNSHNCRVFEGNGIKTYIDTSLLKIFCNVNKDKNVSFYTVSEKSPAIVKDGDIILGCICPVRYTEAT